MKTASFKKQAIGNGLWAIGYRLKTIKLLPMSHFLIAYSLSPIACFCLCMAYGAIWIVLSVNCCCSSPYILKHLLHRYIQSL